ncbi:hypothetical protein BV25DRAFT_1800682 [Artomyces pyxidatus]|uniref:Uncharacterized protein n=1 Tax=Artomyces pyxidatus TaxID=48021 RepID=A0ACB8T648_9AGAM|nr:hypothetical protein BV25DRAFT_1800682 [Artomyces pyxidatus]
MLRPAGLAPQSCCCGRSFLQPSALTHHQKSCTKSKKRLSSALANAKEAWMARKKARTVRDLSSTPIPTTLPESQEIEDDSHFTLLERRAWKLRSRRSPGKYHDYLPEAAAALPPPQSVVSETTQHIDNRPLIPPQILTTGRNNFGLFRRYHAEAFPTHDPEDLLTLQSLSNDNDGSKGPILASEKVNYHPYPNAVSFRLGEWFWNGSHEKSKATFRDLLDIVGDDAYRPQDVSGTHWDQINAILAFESEHDCEEWQDEEAGWLRASVKISVPFHPRRGIPNPPKAGPRTFIVDDFYHRDLLSVIREKLSRHQDDPLFHYEPYELHWQPYATAEPVRVHGELYTSPAFLDEHRKLLESAPEPGCDLPRHIVALMFWSDATHLTSFGDAKLWPLYLYFGNESKYRRCQPSSHLCEHVAYFRSLPDEFQEFGSQQTAGGKAPNPAFRTHCARELVHAQLKILINDRFLEAWVHGLVIKCCDGVHRRFYPRIFTYSADYPEKILLASIRNLGSCPCPRCLVPLSRVHLIGTETDMAERNTKARIDDSQRQRKIAEARKLIYKKNLQVSSDAVEAWLQEESLVPNENAFSERLSPLGFNMFAMFAVDLMHEWELGVGRSIFVHLLRILATLDDGLLVELDRRFRLVPSFGTAIRRFSRNTSEMKQMAARDIENIWQCAIPVFEGLLPEPHNGKVLRLLFVGANWHGMAKLRMHTDPSLTLFDAVTRGVGEELRVFSEETCLAFQTRELQREADARIRRASRKAAKSKSDASVPPLPPQAVSPPKAARELKSFNMNTYKCHSLGDYPGTIRWIGTTDSYSTEPAKLEHHTSKVRYKRTSRREFVRDMARIERRQHKIRQIRARTCSATDRTVEDTPSASHEHYNVGVSENYPVNITLFQQENSRDPAVKHFTRKLKAHIAPRIHAMLLREVQLAHSRGSPGPSNSAQPSPIASNLDTDAEREHAANCVFFKSDRMYEHRTMRINYTTYDVRRGQDIIHSGTSNRDIMVLSPHVANEDSSVPPVHRFWFGRVLGIYHVNVVYTGPGMVNFSSRRLYFLWVRWFQYDGNPATDDDQRLDALRFVPLQDDDAFGFVDPDDVLRCCHIIPAFAKGKLRTDGSKISSCANDANDWHSYYVNRFADRDLLMRFHWGLAVGHRYSWTRVDAAERFPLLRDRLLEGSRNGPLTGLTQCTEQTDSEGCTEDGTYCHGVDVVQESSTVSG